MSQIKLKEIKKTYPNGNIGIESVNFNIEKGDIAAYLGPNGAGKTTTLNILSTLLKPDFGECFINGYDLTKEDDKIREIMGYLPEIFGLYPTFNVYQNIEFFAKLRTKKWGDLKSKIENYLKWMDLYDKKDQKAYTLSKGLKQRVGLIIAIIHEPDILLLDEPTNGLDPNATERFLDLIREINKKGVTILFSTHLLFVAEKICNKVIIIDKGKTLLSSPIVKAKDILHSKNLEEVYFKITQEERHVQ